MWVIEPTLTFTTSNDVSELVALKGWLEFLSNFLTRAQAFSKAGMWYITQFPQHPQKLRDCSKFFKPMVASLFLLMDILS
jgi:hypothetical protein